MNSDVNMAKLLIKHGANIDAYDYYEKTPLFYAVEKGNHILV